LGIGGSCHITHEFNRGTSDYWLVLHTQEGKRYLDWDRDIAQTILPNGAGLASGPQRLYHDGGKLIYQVENEVCTIDFVVSDVSPVYPLMHGKDHVALQEMAPSHFEGGCRLKGRLVLDGAEYQINALGYRDHSWGRRKEILVSHRYITGTAGADFSFAAATMVMPYGNVFRLGQIVTPDHIIVADNVDIVVHGNDDGFSHRGVDVELKFDDGTLQISGKTIQGGMGPTRHVVGFEGVGTFSTNTGISGFCCLETSDNLRDGRKMPQKSSDFAIVEKGLTWRPGKK
jgi:hypothetical protein